MSSFLSAISPAYALSQGSNRQKMRPSGQSASGDMIPKGYAAGQLQQYTPQQMDLLSSLYPYLSPGSDLAKLAGGDESAFAPMEERAMKDFQAFTGSLGSRFAGLGMGGIKSGAFQRASTEGAKDFALSLSERRQAIKRQALMDLMGLGKNLLSERPYNRFLIEQQQEKPWWEKLLGASLPAIGAGVGGAFGGLPGAQIGGSVGSAASSAFF